MNKPIFPIDLGVHRRRSGWIVLGFAALAAAGAYVWLRPHTSGPQYVTVKADRGDIVARVTATGTLSALITVQVGSQVSGRISQIHVDFNSPVKKGQLIAKIDPRLFEAALEQARANLAAAAGNLAQAQARAKDARRQAQRAVDLFEQKLVAQSDRDTAQANAEAEDAAVAAAQGMAAQARAALHQAEINLAYTDIVSPTNGVVITRSVSVGQTVAASLQAPTLFVIAEDLRRMQVDTNVAESDVGKLTSATPVTFSVDAYPSERFQGHVRQIRNSAQTVQNVVTYNAVIDVSNDDLRLRPGMTANVTFVYAQKSSALRVSNSALRFRPSPELLRTMGHGENGPEASPPPPKSNADRASDQRTLWVLRDGQPIKLTVRVGVSDGSVTEVVEGELREGDDIITDVKMNKTDKPSVPGGGRLF